MSTAVRKARQELDALMVWADGLVERLAEVSEALVEAEMQSGSQTAIASAGATVFQVGGGVYGQEAWR